MLKKSVILFICILTMSSLACSLLPKGPGTATPRPTNTLPATQTTAPTSTLPGTAVAAATATPTQQSFTPTPTTPSCTFAAAFVTDVTIPDDTEIQPGTSFTKIWRIRNSGRCAWKAGVEWVFISGAQMGGPAVLPLPPLEPAETADVTVDLTAPETAGAYAGYWQVRLTDGTLLSTRFFVRIVVPETNPTPTATTIPPPIIDFFQADVEVADPGDTILLSWETRHSDWVTIYRLVGYQLSSFWDVQASGTMSYTIKDFERNPIPFLLYAGREGAETAQAGVTITLTCPDVWFFSPAPDGCPANAALISDAVEQPFEHGIMVWVKEQDQIYAFFDDPTSPKWNIYTDHWSDGDPIDDPTIEPPAGLYQPVRGFGLIWREEPDVRSRLGWAVKPEAAFSTAYQTTSRFKYNDLYLGALDGNVWRMLPERSGWEKVITTD